MNAFRPHAADPAPAAGAPADTSASPAAARSGAIGVAGVGIVLAILVAGLLWAKWLPYGAKIGTLADTHSWSGGPIFGSAGEPGSTPTLAGAWRFAGAYFAAVWKAALVAIVVAAAMEALVPRRWLVGALNRRTPWGQGVVGGLLALPSMMCSCCTAPVAVGLRRCGAPLGASVAYWLANPLLNPAVLVFLALTLPWEFTVVRAVVGVLVVVGAAAIVTRFATRRSPADERALGAPNGAIAGDPRAAATEFDDATRWSELPGRFLRALARYVAVLVPEYVILVLLTGLLSGWLSDFAHLDQAAGPLALLLVALVGSALVIPTGGEIPVVVGLVAAGASLGAAGALLVTLPALSVPSLLMVARSFSARTVAVLAAWVVLAGVLAGGLLMALG